MAVIRQNAIASLANTLWARVRASVTESPRACPSCERPLKVIEVDDEGGAVELDACVGCQFFWFDHTELSRLGVVLKSAQPDAPPELRRAVAELRVDTLRENRRVEELAENLRDFLCGWWW
jgi:Zn-finger nucleic acid-binding protein